MSDYIDYPEDTKLSGCGCLIIIFIIILIISRCDHKSIDSHNVIDIVRVDTVKNY